MSQERNAQAQVRASDADRERVVEQLRQHTADGRLTMEEFEERMSAAYAAKTYGDLARLTVDLPVDLGRGPAAGRRGPGFAAPPVQDARPGGLQGVPLDSAMDVVGALANAHNDWRAQKHAMRDQMRMERHRQRSLRRTAGTAAALASWAAMSVMLSGIWLIGAIAGSGSHPFWPIWPIGFFGLLIVVRFIKGAGYRG